MIQHPFIRIDNDKLEWKTISGLDELGISAGLLKVGDSVLEYKDDKLTEVKITKIVPLEGNFLTYNFIDMKQRKQSFRA